MGAVITMKKRGRAYSKHWDKWNAYRDLVGKLEGKKPLED